MGSWLTYLGLGGVLGGIALGAALGRSIDWYFGTAGRLCFSNLMMNWGAQLENMKWAYFGREEALFAVRVMDRLFGRLFSVRRLIAVVASTFVVSGFMIVSMMLIVMPHPIFHYLSWAATVLKSFVIAVFLQRSNLVFFVLVLLSFACSFSVTRIASVIVARLLGAARYINLLSLVILCLFQYLLLCYWSPAINYLRRDLIDMVAFPSSGFFIHFSSFPIWRRIEAFYYLSIKLQFLEFFNLVAHSETLVTPSSICALLTEYNFNFYPDIFLAHLSNILVLIPSLTRFSLVVVFLGSFLLRPLRKHPIMQVWENIMVSEKTFTLLGSIAGGIAAGIVGIIRWSC